MQQLLFIILLTFTLSACNKPTTEPEPLALVKTQPYKALATFLEYSATARVISLNDSQLSAEINAAVDKIPAKVGDSVVKGQSLILLNCDNAKHRLQQSKGALASQQAREKLARQRLQRAKKLKRQNSIADEDLDLRQSELEAASSERKALQGQLAIAEREAEQCVIRAPFDGVITERHAQIGQLATTGMVMLRIVDTKNIEVSANIITDEVQSLQNANALYFRYKDKDYPLRIRSITEVINQATRSQEARFTISKDNIPLKSGTVGRVIWRDIAPAIPAYLISRRNDSLGVLTLSANNTVQFEKLPSAQEGQPVIANLPLDTQIITEGRLGLAVDEAVKVVDE